MATEAIDSKARLVVRAGGGTLRKRRRLRHWPLWIGGAILLLVTAACLGAPLLTSWDPLAMDINYTLGAPPFTAGHLLGVDAPFGRDVLSRILYGGRIDLLIGAGGTSVTVIVGTLIGLLAGYIGGWFDAVVMRIVDV